MEIHPRIIRWLDTLRSTGPLDYSCPIWGSLVTLAEGDEMSVRPGQTTLEVVRLLLEHGADVEAADRDGKTALQAVDNYGYIKFDEGQCDEIRRLLVEHGAK
jgi:hypothetical protein